MSRMKIGFPWKKIKRRKESIKKDIKTPNILFLEACQLLKVQRQEFGLSRIELAEKTRITPSVLEAIENGWADKLPERAYLASMLIILENELRLRRNSLNAILLRENKKAKEKVFPSFSIGSIDFLRTWKGSFLYFTLIISTIFGLNHQQMNISRTFSNTVSPILPKPKSTEQKNQSPPNVSNLFHTNQISEDVNEFNLNWLTTLLTRSKSKASYGLLKLNLTRKSKLSIDGYGDYQANFNNIKGSIKLKVLSPVTIKINPQPTEIDQVIWKGKIYLPYDRKNGLYKFGNQSNKVAIPSADRPQKEPRLP